MTQNVLFKTLRMLTVLLGLFVLVGCGSEDSEQAFTDAVEINELNISSLSIVIESGNDTFEAGTTEVARAMAQVSNGGDDIDVTNRVQWSSSDPNAVSVSQSGSIQAQSGIDSTATLFVDWADLSASLAVRVSTDDLDSIALSGPNDVSACSPGHQLRADGTYAPGDVRNISHLVSWTSSNTNLLRVSSSGLVDTLGSGSGNITADYQSQTSTPFTIAVRDNLDTIAVSPSTDVSVTVGATQRFTATASYNDGQPQQDISSTAVWESSATNILSFSSTSGDENLAQGNAAGSSNVSARCAAITPVTSALVSVDVVEPRTIDRVEIRFNGNTLIPDQEVNDSPLQLLAFLVYSDNSTEDVTTRDDTDWSVDSSTGTAASINNTNDKGEVSFNAVGETTFEVEHEVDGQRYRDTIVLTVE